VNLTLLYINSEAVIPAKAGIQPRNTGFPRIKYGAGSVKPGMTNKRKRFLNHYNSSLVVLKNRGFCVNFILIFILAKVPNKEYKKGEYSHDQLGV
jgi:hypothetical protein